MRTNAPALEKAGCTAAEEVAYCKPPPPPPTLAECEAVLVKESPGELHHGEVANFCGNFSRQLLFSIVCGPPAISADL